MAIRVNEESFEQEVLKSDIPVLVDFYSDSCVPCKQMSPVLGDIEDELGDKIKIVKVNVGFDTELAKAHNVMAVPTLKLFKGGREEQTLRGVIKKAALKEKIEEILK